MKETIKVNLCGQLFDLDSDAYQRLRNYLDSIEHRFSSKPDEAREILEDIEARIIELINTEYADKTSFVVTLPVIEVIISKLGTADDMDGNSVNSEDTRSEEADRNDSFTIGKKRLYRDVDNAILGGVASGLGNYAGVDRVWVRVLFIVLTFFNLVFIPFIHLSGFGIIAYLILWIVVPAARTRAQKLEMYGKAVNVENIGHSVKQEYERVKSDVKNFSSSKEYRNLENSLAEFFRIIGNILLVLLKVVASIITVSLLIALIAVIIGFFVGGSVLFPDSFLNFGDWDRAFDWNSLSWYLICIFLLIIIPIIALFVKLIKWIFDLPTRDHIFSGIAATIWVIALICLIVMLVNKPIPGAFRTSYSSNYTLKTNSDTLYIGLNDLTKGIDANYENYHVFGYSFVWDESRDELLRNPKISIINTTDDNITMEVQRQFNCFDKDKCHQISEQLCHYDWQLNDSLLLLDRYFICNENEAWRMPLLKIIVHIPEKFVVNYSPETTEFIVNNEPAEKEK